MYLNLFALTCGFWNASTRFLVVRSYVVHAAVRVLTQDFRRGVEYCLFSHIHARGAVMIGEPRDLMHLSECQVIPALCSWQKVDVRNVGRHIQMAFLRHGGDGGAVGKRLVNEQCHHRPPIDAPRLES